MFIEAVRIPDLIRSRPIFSMLSPRGESLLKVSLIAALNPFCRRVLDTPRILLSLAWCRVLRSDLSPITPRSKIWTQALICRGHKRLKLLGYGECTFRAFFRIEKPIGLIFQNGRVMINLGSTIAIIQSQKIVLTKREDFEVWCLPGGMVEPGESLFQAAIREAYEETGLEVELEKLVGVYSRTGSGVDVHAATFVARPIGGTLKPQAGEVLEVYYFAPNALPKDMLWWHRQQVDDAFNGSGGSVAWAHNIKSAEVISSRQELYALRDRSGLARPEFYRHFFEKRGTDGAKKKK